VEEIIRAPLEVNLAALRRNVRFIRFRMTRQLKFCDSPLFEEISNAHTGLRIGRLAGSATIFPQGSSRLAKNKIKTRT
jgi:hypothetical protein